MSTAKRIRERRIMLELSEAQLASDLGISIAAYGDLEQYEDELATCITLKQANQLSLWLGIPLLELLAEDMQSRSMPSPEQVAEQVASYIASAGVSVESFGEQVGWDLQAFLQEPSRVAPGLPIMFFRDLAAGVGGGALSLVPHLHVA
jgi:transcriptional regulator with XRE-family HTH domain